MIVAPDLLESIRFISWGPAETTLGVAKLPPSVPIDPKDGGGGAGIRIIRGGPGGIRIVKRGGSPGGGPGGRLGRPGGGPGGKRSGGNIIGGRTWGRGGPGMESVPGGARMSICSGSFVGGAMRWSSSMSFVLCTTSISFMNSSMFWPERASIFCCKEVGFGAPLDVSSSSSSALEFKVTSSEKRIVFVVEAEASSSSSSEQLEMSGGGPGGTPGGSSSMSDGRVVIFFKMPIGVLVASGSLSSVGRGIFAAMLVNMLLGPCSGTCTDGRGMSSTDTCCASFTDS